MNKYFVVQLDEADRPAPDKQFEIQLLDNIGRAAACAYVGAEETSVEVAGIVVPAPVIAAARRQPLGQGDYVNDDGQSLPPF